MSDTMFAIRTPQHDFPLGTLASCVGTMGTAAYALVSEWWHRYHSRLELASYSHEHARTWAFRLTWTAKSESRFGTSEIGL